MEFKNYTLIIRTNTGVWDAKTRVNCDIHSARLFLDAMLRAHPRSNRGEIIEGDRDYNMDFRVKPIVTVSRREDGLVFEDN